MTNDTRNLDGALDLDSFIRDSGFKESIGFQEYISSQPTSVLDTLNLEGEFSKFIERKLENGPDTDDVETICEALGMMDFLQEQILFFSQMPAAYHGDLHELITGLSKGARLAAQNAADGVTEEDPMTDRE